MKCEGLYFPKAYECNLLSVVTFQVTWNDSELLFKVQKKTILMSDVQSTITSIISEEMPKFRMMHDVSETNLKIPLTKSYIIEQFGPNAYQLQSGESIVIIPDKKVNKYPLLPQHQVNLLEILLQDLVSPRFLVPEKRRFLRVFFVYPKLKPPISVHIAKQNLKGAVAHGDYLFFKTSITF